MARIAAAEVPSGRVVAVEALVPQILRLGIPAKERLTRIAVVVRSDADSPTPVVGPDNPSTARNACSCEIFGFGCGTHIVATLFVDRGPTGPVERLAWIGDLETDEVGHPAVLPDVAVAAVIKRTGTVLPVVVVGIEFEATTKTRQVVGTPRGVGGRTSRTQRRQQQCHQDTNDGNHDKEFDERETASTPESGIIHEKTPKSVPIEKDRQGDERFASSVVERTLGNICKGSMSRP